MRLLPKSLGDLERIDIEIYPPSYPMPNLMQLPVMTTGHTEFVADLHPQRPWLPTGVPALLLGILRPTESAALSAATHVRVFLPRQSARWSFVLQQPVELVLHLCNRLQRTIRTTCTPAHSPAARRV